MLLDILRDKAFNCRTAESIICVRCGSTIIVEAKHVKLAENGSIDATVTYDGTHLAVIVNKVRLVVVKVNLPSELSCSPDKGLMVGLSCLEGSLILEKLHAAGGDGQPTSLAPKQNKAQDQPAAQAQEEVILMEQWSCPKCTLLNAADAASCGVCGEKAPTAVAQSKSKALESPKSSDLTWDCPTCTYKNEASSTACEMCNTPMPNASPAPVELMDLTDETQRANDGLLRRRNEVLVGALKALPATVAAEPPSAPGQWDTSSGILEISEVDPASQPMWALRGSFQGCSPVTGVACLVSEGDGESLRWEVSASWRSNKWLEKGDDALRKAGVYEIDAKLDEAGGAMSGTWAHGGGAKGQLQASLSADSSGFRGLAGASTFSLLHRTCQHEGRADKCLLPKCAHPGALHDRWLPQRAAQSRTRKTLRYRQPTAAAHDQTSTQPAPDAEEHSAAGSTPR